MTRARVFNALLTVVLVPCVLTFVPVVSADTYVRIVRLSDIDGDVQIDRNTGQGFEKAVQNLPITQGVRIQTGANGRAEVEFENGSALRLTSNSSVEFSQLALRSNGDRVNEVLVKDGTIYVHYKHKGDENFQLKFANRDVNLTKDVNLRLKIDGSQGELAVLKGEVQLAGVAEADKLKKNQTLTFDLNEASKVEFAKSVDVLPTDQWDKERTQYLDQYASSGSYGSPYRYGYGDLYRYGSFLNTSGYGLVWVPSNMGYGWDPYSNGYWSYYPGSGYVWVSGFAWGWTPYRYGNWAFIPAVGGWAWVPGRWNHWNTGVSVVNPPTNWHHPTAPPPGSGTTVVVGPGPRGPRHIPVDGVAPNPGQGVLARDPNGPRGGPSHRTIDVKPGADGGTKAAAPPKQGAAHPAAVTPSRPAPMPRPQPSAPSRSMSPAPAPAAVPHSAPAARPSRSANPK